MQPNGLRGMLFAVLALLFRGRRGPSLSFAGHAGVVVEAVEAFHGGVGKEALALDVDLLSVADVGHVRPRVAAQLLFAQTDSEAVGVVADLVLAEKDKRNSRKNQQTTQGISGQGGFRRQAYDPYDCQTHKESVSVPCKAGI